MTPESLAALHALAFTEAPRPWSASEFATLLGAASTVCVAEPDGFALGRVAGPEAELLTLAVRPSARRQGVGGRLLAGFEAAVTARGAVELLLEVAATNAAARALYLKSGYLPVGRRPAYYRRSGRAPADAIVLRRGLRRPGKSD